MRKATGSHRIYADPGKTSVLVPEFAVEDLPSAERQPTFLRLKSRAEHSDDDGISIDRPMLRKYCYVYGLLTMCGSTLHRMKSTDVLFSPVTLLKLFLRLC